MVEVLALDEMPASEDGEEVADDGKVDCPECNLRFNPRGLKRHITMSHRGGVSDNPNYVPGGNTARVSRVRINIEERWAQFQTGCSLLVSLACSQCASALVEDAEKDAKAIATFCENKPKLRKQVEDFLSASDFLLLVGALGGTAQKMVSHHAIGQKLGMGIPSVVGHVDANGMAPHERMANFMAQMPPEVRHKLIDDALQANQRQAQQQQPSRFDSEPVPGGEPMPVVEDVAEADLRLREVVHRGTDFAVTAPNL